MRTRKIVRNWIFSLSFQVFVLVCGVVFPRQIILTYGSAVNGMTQTVNQIINVLNLLQAGAVGASVFMLFKPVAENDYEKINSIMSSTRNYFYRIGNVFLVCILILAPIFTWLKTGEGLTKFEIIASFSLLCFNALFYFYFYSWYDIVFQSYQQQYVFYIGSIIEKFIYYALLIIVLKYRVHFLFMYVAMLMGSIGRLSFLNNAFKKRYGKKIIYNKDHASTKITGRRYLLINQIAIHAVESTPIMVVSFCYGLRYASIFSVYYMVYGLVKTLINTIHASCNTSFGNYIATKTNDEVSIIFSLIQYVFTIVGTVMSTCCAALFIPFIKLYTNDISDANYIVPALAIFGVGYIVSYVAFIPYYMLTNTYGLFKETYKQSIFCCIISVSASVLLGLIYGMPYTVSGCIVYNILMTFCRIKVASREIEWFTTKKLPQRLCFLIIMVTVAFFAESCFGGEFITDWLSWIIAAVMVGVFSVVLSYIYSVILEKDELQQIMSYAKAFLRRSRNQAETEH